MDALRLARPLSPSPAASRPALHVRARAHVSAAPARLLLRLWPRRAPDETPAGGAVARCGSWVMKILRVRSLWAEEEKKGGSEEEGEDGDPAAEKMDEGDRCVGCVGCGCGEGSGGCDTREEEVEFDRESFSRFLQRVSLADAKLYARMSYLGALAYSIPKIKPANLLKHHGLRFVTSSLEKKAKHLDEGKKETPARIWEAEEAPSEVEETMKKKTNGYKKSSSAAYSIAASAASFVQSQTRGFLPFSYRKGAITKQSLEEGSRNGGNSETANSELASFMATAESVTTVVAAKEEIKQAVAEDLNSARSPPCEWFICDEARKGTRYFVIQGSESLASWQANLLFEPIRFEGLDVLVHRGIYEAAKGIYKQILPEVQAHLKFHGSSATFRFTGHSLGGSLSILVNLMLLIRGEVPVSSLLPVITFGAPCILCGGDYLLRKLRLPQNHVQAIMMHRDIVPRAFSCNYPDHVAQILKAINGKFRNHPCLRNQKLLYAPLGKLLILQPEEKHSPFHHLLPPCSGLYLLGHSSPEYTELLEAARSTFLNSPHPMDILSKRSAYSSNGTVTRNHQVLAYLRSLYGVVRRECELIREVKNESQGWAWWPLLENGFHASTTMGWQSTYLTAHHFGFSGVFHGGKKKLKRLGRLVASQHANLFVMVLLPARCLFVGMLTVVRLG